MKKNIGLIGFAIVSSLFTGVGCEYYGGKGMTTIDASTQRKIDEMTTKVEGLEDELAAKNEAPVTIAPESPPPAGGETEGETPDAADTGLVFTYLPNYAGYVFHLIGVGPTVTSYSCVDCDTEKPVIQVQFDEPVAKPIAASLLVGTNGILTAAAVAADYGADQKTVNFFLSAPFQPMTYGFEVLHDLVKDQDGNPMSANYDWSHTFKAEEIVPVKNVEAKLLYPDKPTDVSQYQLITVSFSEKMNATSVKSALTVHEAAPNGKKVDGESGFINDSNLEFSFDPAGALNAATTYYVVLDGTAVSEGGAKVGPLSWAFTVKQAAPKTWYVDLVSTYTGDFGCVSSIGNGCLDPKQYDPPTTNSPQFDCPFQKVLVGLDVHSDFNFLYAIDSLVCRSINDLTAASEEKVSVQAGPPTGAVHHFSAKTGKAFVGMVGYFSYWYGQPYLRSPMFRAVDPTNLASTKDDVLGDSIWNNSEYELPNTQCPEDSVLTGLVVTSETAIIGLRGVCKKVVSIQ